MKGQVRAEWVEWGHVAAENTREHQRILGMKFYVTLSTASFFILFTTSMLLFNFFKERTRICHAKQWPTS